jgi:hypothetical protein
MHVALLFLSFNQYLPQATVPLLARPTTFAHDCADCFEGLSSPLKRISSAS